MTSIAFHSKFTGGYPSSWEINSGTSPSGFLWRLHQLFQMPLRLQREMTSRQRLLVVVNFKC